MRIKLLDKRCKPKKAHENDVGFDLRARENHFLFPFCRKKIPVGVCIEIPLGYCGDIRPRSGNSSRALDVKLGSIDPEYTGEVSVVLKNDTFWFKKINKYDRIAQLVVVRISDEGNGDIEEVDSFEITDRGDSGFGETGVL